MTEYPSGLCKRSARNGQGEGGFTYLGVLIVMAIISITVAAGVQVGAIAQRSVAEEELLMVGAEYKKALVSYSTLTPIGQPRAPSSLSDLLKDKRFPNPVRHLRKLYADPLTGKDDWGIVQFPGTGGILGVFSLSDATPIKVGNFDLEFQGFEGKTSYRDWQFALTLNPAVTPSPVTYPQD